MISSNVKKKYKLSANLPFENKPKLKYNNNIQQKYIHSILVER